MAILATQSVTRAGLTPAYGAAAAGGDKFTPNDRTVLHVKNASAASVTVTVDVPAEAFPGAAIADTAVAVPAGSERLIGPFPPRYYADPTDAGLADVTYSASASVTVGAFRVS